MIDPTLLEDVTRWHDQYLIREEHSDHLMHLMDEIGHRELALRHDSYAPPRPGRKTGLAKIKMAKLRLLQADWARDYDGLHAEANVFLGRAVDAGLVSLRTNLRVGLVPRECGPAAAGGASQCSPKVGEPPAG